MYIVHVHVRARNPDFILSHGWIHENVKTNERGKGEKLSYTPNNLYVYTETDHAALCNITQY